MANKYALDLETWLISKEFIAPPPVVLSMFGEGKHNLTKDIESMMKVLFEEKAILIWHNASFDMSVLYTHFLSLRRDIFDAYRDGRIKCTKIRESLLHLSVVGHLNNPKSLDACVDRYFEVDISSTKSDPDAWRLRYKELMDIHLGDWPEEAVKYALDDTMWGMKVFDRQAELANPEGRCSMGTENLQTYFDFVGVIMTMKGFKIDTALVQKTKDELEGKSEEPLEALIEAGYATKKAKGKDAGKVSIRQKLLREYILENYPTHVQYTKPSKTKPNGQVSLSKEAIMEYPSDPILDSLKEYEMYKKLLSTYLPNLLRGPTMHPQFNALVETGRTSSRGHSVKNRDDRKPSENVQNLPRVGNIREAHIARPGMVLVSIDYGHLELDCLAQVTYEMFGESEMMKAINAGKDPHSVMGAQLMGLKNHKKIDYDSFFSMLKKNDKQAKFFRQMAKAANFGYPGGLGAKRMVDYARLSYGIDDMTLEQSQELLEVFFETYPEVKKLHDWYRYQEGVEGWAYASSGRWRARCGYCVGLNGIALQSRSADGAKAAGLLLAEACEYGSLQGSSLLAFIHDEYIIEMPNDSNLEERIDAAMTLMLEGMSTVLPDVRITVEADAMKRWVKDGPFVLSTRKSIEPRRVAV